jgi:protein-S-isoprenylcysteine O-methyltransferase Ste14
MAVQRHFENWLWIVPLVALVAIAPHPRPPFGSEAVGEVVDIFGALLIATGAAVRVCARGWKHEQGKEQLVITGPYACVRHPLYLGTLLCGLGVCAIHGSWALFAGFALAYVLSHLVVIRREEENLALRFPEAMAAYKKRVPSFFPAPWAFPSLFRTWPSDLGRALVKEADAIFLWPAAGLAIRLWELARYRGGFRANRFEVSILVTVLVVMLVGWALNKQGPKRVNRAR